MAQAFGTEQSKEWEFYMADKILNEKEELERIKDREKPPSPYPNQPSIASKLPASNFSKNSNKQGIVKNAHRKYNTPNHFFNWKIKWESISSYHDLGDYTGYFRSIAWLRDTNHWNGTSVN